MGATFAATESIVANTRKKNDPINGAAGGCAAGFLAGLRGTCNVLQNNDTTALTFISQPQRVHFLLLSHRVRLLVVQWERLMLQVVWLATDANSTLQKQWKNAENVSSSKSPRYHRQ